MENQTNNEVALNESAFSPANFEQAQRQAKAICSSDLVPKEYRNNIPNTLIALDISNRIGASPLMVMQHLYIVHGKPSWSSTFLIAAINNSNKFKAPLRFEITGEGEQKGCIAWTIDKTGERLESPKVTMAMAKAEGWIDKNGSKWKTMPELMMRYRSASFFSRLFCPEITMGMQSTEEIMDVEGIVIETNVPEAKEKTELELAIDKIIDALELYNGIDKNEIHLECAAAREANKFDMAFAKQMAKKLNIEL